MLEKGCGLHSSRFTFFSASFRAAPRDSWKREPWESFWVAPKSPYSSNKRTLMCPYLTRQRCMPKPQQLMPWENSSLIIDTTGCRTGSWSPPQSGACLSLNLMAQDESGDPIQNGTRSTRPYACENFRDSDVFFTG